MTDESPLEMMFLALSKGEGGINEAYDAIQEISKRMDAWKTKDRTCRIPQEGSRIPLEVWGIEFREGTEIQRAFGSIPTFEVDLPPGWSHVSKGAHNFLRDNMGRDRLHWYIHGWDPVNVSPCSRFSNIHEDIRPSEAVVKVMDGNKELAAFHINYPHPRDLETFEDGSSGYFLSNAAGEEARHENYLAKDAAYNLAREWLEKNFPGWQDTMKSWTL